MRPELVSHWYKPDVFLAVGFGSGLSPKAPGTVGTLAALPFYWVFMSWPLWSYVVLLVSSFLFGVWLCHRVGAHLGVHDHPAIVWDEFVGMWLALLPLHTLGFSWWGLLLAFVMFRLLDILKPWPISWADKELKGGWGVMLDDVIAGIGAALVVYLIGVNL